ncbi:hypothetical protein HDU93_004039, partial [Gonapodya sp. JEL0774]
TGFFTAVLDMTHIAKLTKDMSHDEFQEELRRMFVAFMPPRLVQMELLSSHLETRKEALECQLELRRQQASTQKMQMEAQISRVEAQKRQLELQNQLLRTQLTAVRLEYGWFRQVITQLVILRSKEQQKGCQ